ncbi:MAG: site-2 protease family protein [Bacilli bacterium]|nr:site-2 protease family protein [Bacilli bacterium]
MIIKNFLNKIKFSKYSFIIILLCFITGLIKELSIILILIIFHEFGHYLMSVIFKWNINKIIIYPFGGLIKYEEEVDKPLLEELLITISGPLNQWIIFIFFFILYKNYYISSYYYNNLYNYHISMFIFNIIPIIPLDGSKLINIVLNKLFNYRLSYNILLVISLIFLLGFVLTFRNNYSYLIVISFLIYELINYVKNKNIMFNRFIFEKYLYKNKYKKYIKIRNIKSMKRNKKHLIKNNGTYITEKEYIKKIKGV